MFRGKTEKETKHIKVTMKGQCFMLDDCNLNPCGWLGHKIIGDLTMKRLLMTEKNITPKRNARKKFRIMRWN